MFSLFASSFMNSIKRSNLISCWEDQTLAGPNSSLDNKKIVDKYPCLEWGSNSQSQHLNFFF
jgi:hypothetical protein